MNTFKTYHPIVNFIYFVLIIGFSCVFMHPVCLCISLAAVFLYSVMLRGVKMIKTNLLYIVPMVIGMAIINPLINPQGETVVGYLPNGNPLTLEAFCYGIAAAVMIGTVISWFICGSDVVTNDKVLYLFGRIIPNLSLIISMTFRMIPRFIMQIKAVAKSQKCMGRETNNITQKIKYGISILSIVTTWALENAIETADSMRARGYGSVKRTAYSNYVFERRDIKALLWIIVSGVYVIAGAVTDGMNFNYFPSINGSEMNLLSISYFVIYGGLCFFPIIADIWEAGRWAVLKLRA